MKSRTKVNPPMMCREGSNEVKTGNEGRLPGETQWRNLTGQCARGHCARGHCGSPACRERQFMGGWGVEPGNPVRDAKRNAASGRPARANVSKRGQGAEQLVVALRTRETGKEPRGCLLHAILQPSTGEAGRNGR